MSRCTRTPRPGHARPLSYVEGSSRGQSELGLPLPASSPSTPGCLGEVQARKARRTGKCLICWLQNCLCFHLRRVSKTLRLPRWEGSSSEAHSSSQRLDSLAVTQPTATSGTIQMTLNFLWKWGRRGAVFRAVCPRASIFPSLGLCQGKKEPKAIYMR